MKIGTNELVLSHAEMIRCVQHYLDTKLFQQGMAPRVEVIVPECEGCTFHVVLGQYPTPSNPP